MNINLELYKVFYYVAKNKGISRAANELMVSQPAISKSIKALEDQINTQLFIRKRDGVILTKNGEILYKKIKDAMDLIYSAESDLDSILNENTGVINIGASKTIIHEFLMPYIKEYHKINPNIKIKIYTDGINELIRKSKMGLVDVLFTNLPYDFTDDFNQIKLKELHDCFVVNEDYKYLLNQKMTKNDLEKLPLLLLTKETISRTRLDNYCLENNIVINPVMEFGSNTLIKDFTLAGFGVGMLTEEHIKEELNDSKLFKININLDLSEKSIGMTWDKNNKNIIVKNFINYIKNNIGD